jgi:hypothetical protein
MSLYIFLFKMGLVSDLSAACVGAALSERLNSATVQSEKKRQAENRTPSLSLWTAIVD